MDTELKLPADNVPENLQNENVEVFASDSIALQWNNLCMSLVSGDKSQLTILSNISGLLPEGNLCAVLGSSGSGKTSFLNMLSGRIHPEMSVSGFLQVNGIPLSNAFCQIGGYVLQQDFLFSDQTVDETILFRSYLRLHSLPEERRKARLEAVVKQLQLKKCRNTYIAAISGGQRKRLSVASELLRSISLLLLDEPTSGLDASMSYGLIESLSYLAKQHKKTIICSLHQPSSAMFQLLDYLLVLHEGHMVYYGLAKTVLQYFAIMGFECPDLCNPADFIMDIISLEQHINTSITEVDDFARAYYLVEAWKSHNDLVEISFENSTFESSDTPKPITTDMKSPFEVDITDQIQIEIDSRKHVELSPDVTRSICAKPRSALESETAPLTLQFRLLYVRATTQASRNRQLIVIRLASTCFQALLIGAVFFQLNNSQSSVQSRQGLLFLALANMAFSGLFGMLMVFPAEKNVFFHERYSGLYDTTSYVMAKSLAETPIFLLYPFIYTNILYWMTGLQATPEKYFVFLFLMMATTFAAEGVGIFAGAIGSDMQASQAIANMLMVVFMVLAGLFITSTSITGLFAWIQYIDFFWYGYRVALANEMRGLVFACSEQDIGGCILTGEQVLARNGAENTSIIGYLFIIIGLGIAFRVMAYIALRMKTVSRYKHL